MIGTEFYIPGGNLPLQKVCIPLGFSTSGPICRAPLRAPCAFCIFLKFREFPDFCGELWNFWKLCDFSVLWFLWFSRQSRLRISDIPKELLVFLRPAGFRKDHDFHKKMETSKVLSIFIFYGIYWKS